MSDLINRDSLLKKCVHIDGLFSDVVSAFDIAYEPTVDAVPVVHGKWIKKHDDIIYWWECSECGNRENVEGRLSRFCTDCGARMDGADNE